MLAPLALSQLLQACAPDVGSRTMTAIIHVESGANPLAIHDNTLRRSFAPHDARQAVVWANQLLALHHSVDLGLSQINDANLPRLGLTVPQVFDACSNVGGGSHILALDYRAAAQQFGPGQIALRHAIGAYNTGSIFAGGTYIDKILTAAGLGASETMKVPDLEDMPAVGAAPAINAVPVIGAVPAMGTPLVLRRIAKPRPSGPRPNVAPILVTSGVQGVVMPSRTVPMRAALSATPHDAHAGAKSSILIRIAPASSAVAPPM